jgi:hypothetical protein
VAPISRAQLFPAEYALFPEYQQPVISFFSDLLIVNTYTQMSGIIRYDSQCGDPGRTEKDGLLTEIKV